MEDYECPFCKVPYVVKVKQNKSQHLRYCDNYITYRVATLTYDFLYNEYIIKGKSAKQISEDTGIATNPVIKQLRRFNINTRTIKESHNMDHYIQKKDTTCLTRFGAINPLSKGTIPYNNRNETVLKKYGVSNVRKDPIIINKIRRSVAKWRKDNNTHSTKGMIHSQKTKTKMRLSWRKNADKRTGRLVPAYNINSIPIIEEYGRTHGYNFQHAENGGEVTILGYFVDGYDKEKNVVLEIDEKHHYKDGTLRPRDIIRQKAIEDHLGCKFIRIRYENKEN